MQQALELARQGVALASPNPCVGAVLVAPKGEIVGRGTHTYEGRKHAEVLAIAEAGERARGATLYLNLEPCCMRGALALAPTPSLRLGSNASSPPCATPIRL